MAEINQTSAPAGSGGKVRAKKQSTKIDMTPMVDLAFLLLTFFILTTTFNEPRVLEVAMPDKQGEPPLVNEHDVLSLVLGKNDQIYWWMGLASPPKTTNYSRDGIRKVLLQKVRDNPQLVVLIKPQDESKFQNIVDILDEMDITGMKRYAIVKFTRDDEDVVAHN